jgi:phage-related protein
MSENDALPSRELIWIGASKKDLLGFPKGVLRLMGFALRAAQDGGKHEDAKPLQGFHGATVLEVPVRFEGDAYRMVYTVTFETAVYVLHAFEKKSKHGVKTPKEEIELVRHRLQAARELEALRLEVRRQEQGT